MCELLALTATRDIDVALSFGELVRHGGDTGRSADGWGVAYYEGADAVVLREAHAASRSRWARCLVDFPFRSRSVIAHIRKATQGEISLRNTQPFQRELDGRIHVFAHNGNLHHVKAPALTSERFTPIGTTDSEIAFCQFMNQVAADTSRGDDLPFETVWGNFVEFSKQMARLGPANMLYANGTHIFAHADRRRQSSGAVEPPGLVILERHCPPGSSASGLAGVTVSGDAASVIIIASVPLSAENWRGLPRGTVLALSSGRIAREESIADRCAQTTSSDASAQAIL